MPEVKITIGGRSFDVACQAGEEHYLEAAAGLLNTEAEVLSEQIGRLPEGRMLLMAGLMLADKTAGVEDKLAAAQEKLAEAEAAIEALRSVEPTRVEVPVIPDSVGERLAEIAARVEAMADAAEEADGEQQEPELAESVERAAEHLQDEADAGEAPDAQH